METTAVNVSTPLIPGMAQMEPGIDPESPLGRLLKISTRLMDRLYFCPAIPPDMCRELAQTTKSHNRKPSPNHIALIAKMMKAGGWCDRMGWDIHFHRDGWLANGQHRLTAAARANSPFYALIHTGLTDRNVAAIDQNRKRKPSDVLAISFGGIDNAVILSAVARVVIEYKLGDLTFNTPIDPYTVCELAASFSDKQKELVYKSQKVCKEIGLLASILGGIILLFNEKRPEKAESFIDRLTSGLTTDPTDPAYLLRQYAIKRKITAQTRFRWDRKGCGQAIIKAINLETTNAKVGVLVTVAKNEQPFELACYPVKEQSKKQASLLDV